MEALHLGESQIEQVVSVVMRMLVRFLSCSGFHGARIIKLDAALVI